MFKGFIFLIQKICTDYSEVEGRDKLTKMLIYAFKLYDALKSILLKQKTYDLQKIGSNFQKARQIMRFGKFIAEYYTVLKLIKQQTADQFGRLVRILCHCIFSFYWVADNIALLSSFDLLQIQEYQMHQTAMSIKFIGLCIAAFLNLRSWFRMHHMEIRAKKEIKYLQGSDNLKKSKQLNKLIKQQWKMFLLCLKIYGDMLPSIAKSAIAKKLFKFEIPRVIQALGGLINAFVSCLLVSL